MMKRGILTLLLGVALVVAFSGMAAKAENIEMELECHKLIRSYWNMTEALYILQEYPFKNAQVGELERDYIVKARSYRKHCESFSDEVVKQMRTGSADRFFSFSQCYKTQKPVLKRALDPAVKHLVERITADAVNHDGRLIQLIPERHRDNLLQDYFPGYGYTDPNYIYRKGKEVRRELMHAYWKTEQETIQTTNYMEMTIAVEMMASLEAQVDFLKILKLFEIEINGKIVAAAKVSFQVNKTLVTTCQRKYERNKVWFELFHASKDYFWEPQWVQCGETYEFFEEPTGEQVMVGSELAPAPPVPPIEDNDDEYEQALVW